MTALTQACRMRCESTRERQLPQNKQLMVRGWWAGSRAEAERDLWPPARGEAESKLHPAEGPSIVAHALKTLLSSIAALAS